MPTPAKKAKARPVVYSIHPSIKLVQDWMDRLPEETGRSYDQWMAHINKAAPKDEAARREWLKTTYKHGNRAAQWLAEFSVGKGVEDFDPKVYLKVAPGMVDALYEGKKAHLRPIHDRLVQAALELGDDVRLCPCKTMLPFYRNHVFAQVKPSTNTRIDLGLALGATKAPKRLIDTGGLAKKDRITHRIAISTPEDIDDEVLEWLATAYERDGK